MVSRSLDRRALNRALLARQHLLVPRRIWTCLEALRAPDRPASSVRPKAPYFALWTRLGAFAPRDLSDLLEDFSLARGTLMRGTLAHRSSQRTSRRFDR
jgi:hypothetical protein